ncbi:protein-L-isoaspartate(D-aspartate) O-methyltransferase [Asanoa hainanensis]|uniref:Protein-L-isoaspartate O-methyltransferase n=1 Tax=Asanoa hainanensis TaxID=560556 RepID=A0A239PG40_9ACTN|nr:methyltransferase, FxLD system [Asanoa hainanensis]SNT66013.1 protein-L-isoaspartate(D-aspartate) O-methyltransferase [Asanoa hainanensis]
MDTDHEPDIEQPPDPQPTSRWRQINLTFADWQTAEHYGTTRLAPTLSAAEDTGAVVAYWFIRKNNTWRLRLLPGDRLGTIYAVLAAIMNDERICRVAEPLYRPEIHAFGGTEAMTVAHTLFHADSRHLLHHLATAGGSHRRELSILLATGLMRAAGLDFYEQGDVWHHVAIHRRPPKAAQPSLRLIAAVKRLITATDHAPHSPLSTNPDWPNAYQHAGHELAHLDRHSALTRDLRGVLTQHTLFLHNRLGINAAHTGLLAAAAANVIFEQRHPAAERRAIDDLASTDSRVEAMKTVNTTPEASAPAELRERLITTLKQAGHLGLPAVEDAFRTVPREQFLPGVELETVYTRRQIVTKRDATGAALSSASSPSLVADMLEQLAPRPGDRILEIGAATGINAALLAHLTGPNGTVVTIELDQDLADGAAAGLDRAGYSTVEVVCGDGALGHPEHAPYDRIIVTAGAWDISAEWWNQLTPSGRIVVPLRLHESGLTRCIAFDRKGTDQLFSATSPLVCGFVPMRGTTEHADHHVRLDTEVVLKLDAADKPDREALGQALTHPPHKRWSGITVTDADSIHHLDLWLLVHTTTAFGRLGVSDNARSSGLVTPAYRWAGAALYQGGTIAYPAFNTTNNDHHELGVIAHGPDAEPLAAYLTELLERWDAQGRPDQPTITAHRTAMAPTQTAHTGTRRHTISRPDTTLTVVF